MQQRQARLNNRIGKLNICPLRFGALAFLVSRLALTVNGLIIATVVQLVVPVAARVAPALTALYLDTAGLGIFSLRQLNGHYTNQYRTKHRVAEYASL